MLVMTLDLDGESPETCAMTRDVSHRALLSDDDFYSQFYEGSEHSKKTIERIRWVLRKRIDPVADQLVPTDYLPLLWEWLDFADLFYALGREFGVTLGCDGTFNGTLDSLICLVHTHLEIETKLVNGNDARN